MVRITLDFDWATDAPNICFLLGVFGLAHDASISIQRSKVKSKYLGNLIRQMLISNK
jgi:hypothetical protein